MFLVVFRSRKRDDIDYAAYAAEGARMEALAREQPGFLAFKSYAAADGETIAISEWTDEAAALRWRRDVAHAAAQRRGRERYYAEYTAFSCAEPRVRQFVADDAGTPPA